jgi:hypothetical protein
VWTYSGISKVDVYENWKAPALLGVGAASHRRRPSADLCFRQANLTP